MRKSLSLLIKPASGACNLCCKYCFYHDVARNREQKSYGMMSDDIMETIVKKAYEYADDTVTFAFQGGEPMLRGLDFFKSLVAYVQKYKKDSVKTFYSIQTNGTMIDNQWAQFFKENNFLVGLSMDGYSDIHDMNRVDKNGRGTFKKVKEASAILDKYKVDYNILCVVTKLIAKHGTKVYNFFKSNGYRYIQFIPCIDDFGDEKSEKPYSLSAKDYGNFLINIFDNWYRDITNNDYVSIRMFDNLVNMIKGYPPEACSMKGICSRGTVIEADGSLYPCDFYVLDKWKIGNVAEQNFEELIMSPGMDEFVDASANIEKECTECRYYNLCRGGCRRYKEHSETGRPLTNMFCRSYKVFYAHAIDKLVDAAKNIQ